METVTTPDIENAETLAKKGIPVKLVKDLEEETPGKAKKEYGQAISKEEFANIPVGQLVQYQGASSKVKSNNGFTIELEDGAKINHNMFNKSGRIPSENSEDIQELKNPKKADLNKDGKLSDYEKKRGAAIEKSLQKEIVKLCYNKGMEKDQIKEVLKRFKSKLNEDQSQEYLVSYQVGSWGVSKNERVKASSPKDAIDIVTQKVKRDGSYITPNNWNGEPVISAKPTTNELAGAQLALSEPPARDYLGDDDKDYEGGMAKSQLLKMKKYAIALCDMIDDESQLEAWVQAKLTKASDYMSAVFHYLDYQSQQSEMMVGSRPEMDRMYMNNDDDE